MGKPRAGKQSTFDHNEDRYPDAFEILSRVQDEVDLPKGGVDRIEVECLPSGEAVWRVWAARAEDPESGYFAAPERSGSTPGQ